MPEASPPRSHHPPEPDGPIRAQGGPSSAAGARSRGGIFNLPLWLRTALSLGIVVVLLVALVLYVSHHNTDSPPVTNLASEVKANREAEILVAEDQAPRVGRLTSASAPAAAVSGMLRAFIAGQIARGEISGPLQRDTCVALRRPAGRRRAFGCVVQAGAVAYQFRGVVDTRTRAVTYCKRDPPPVPSANVPLSPRCLA